MIVPCCAFTNMLYARDTDFSALRFARRIDIYRAS